MHGVDNGGGDGLLLEPEPSSLASKFWLFVKELKRRRVLPFAVVYAVVAVGAIEIARFAFEALRFSLTIWTIFASILLLGFPLVLIIGQVLEVTPEEPLAPGQPRRRSIRWVLPGMGLALALLAIYVLVLRRT